jgi:hypothetical protein
MKTQIEKVNSKTPLAELAEPDDLAVHPKEPTEHQMNLHKFKSAPPIPRFFWAKDG